MLLKNKKRGRFAKFTSLSFTYILILSNLASTHIVWLKLLKGTSHLISPELDICSLHHAMANLSSSGIIAFISFGTTLSPTLSSHAFRWADPNLSIKGGM